MKIKKITSKLCTALVLLAMPMTTEASNSFETPEYWNSTGLDMINAASAYALGYTGKGITLGITDDYVKFSHPEFINKKYSSIIGTISNDYDWTRKTHGSHVGGIIAASKDNVGMHGVAFAADIVSGDFSGDSIEFYNVVNKNSDIKIINQSWGYSVYLDEYGYWNKSIGKEMIASDPALFMNFNVLQNSIINHDKILVFAAGNGGHNMPSILQLMPYINHKTANNFINVINVNSAQFDKATQTSTNSILDPGTDLVKYAEENSISAPGNNINSVYSANNGYIKYSGTSMAAPYVTGVAGLVQEAFPYMNGKQIVDTVLSSANNSFTLPKFVLTFQSDQSHSFNIYYFGDKPNNDAELKADCEKYYHTNKEELKSWLRIHSLEDWEKFMTAFPLKIYDNVPREMIFGQGLLDAGAAVRGLGSLNARRLNSLAYSDNSIYGKKQALYNIDTRGYDSVWSNNISETRMAVLSEDSSDPEMVKKYWYYYNDYLNNDALALKDASGNIITTTGREYIKDYNEKVSDSGLLDLPVGLLKQGAGTLALTGNNTYQGSSIAMGGDLQIDGSIADDAWSIGEGVIAGSGTIAQNLNNYGAVRAGSWGLPGTLKVSGDFLSTGVIQVAVQGDKNSLIEVAGTANIGGSTFARAAGSIYNPEKTYLAIKANNNITSTIKENEFSGMLNASSITDTNTLAMKLLRHNNLGETTAIQASTYGLMENMYDNLAGTSQQREMDKLYSFDKSTAKYTLSQIYGGVQNNLGNITQRSPHVHKAVFSRLYVAQDYDVKNNYKLETGVVPLELDNNNSWWVNIDKNWSNVDANANFDKFSAEGFAVTLGYDSKVSNLWRIGGLFSYATHDLSAAASSGKNKDVRIGAYGEYEKNAFSLVSILEYGRQSNDSTRYLDLLGLKAEGKYDSNTLGLSMRASYNLQHNKNKLWQVKPYGELAVTHYRQDGFSETGANIFGQKFSKHSNTYSSLETGLELGRKLGNGAYSVSLGYKRVLSGNNPSMTATYLGNSHNPFALKGSDFGRDFLVLGVNASAKFAKNWSVKTEAEYEKGSKSQDIRAAVSLNYTW